MEPRGTRLTSHRTVDNHLAHTAVHPSRTRCREGEDKELLEPGDPLQGLPCPAPSLPGTLTSGCSCPSGRTPLAASALHPRGRDTRRGAGSESHGGGAPGDSGILGSNEGRLGSEAGGLAGHHSLPLLRSLSPSTHCPVQLLLALRSRQEGGHRGTSPSWHSPTFTCTRPGPQSGGRWAPCGVSLRRSRELPMPRTLLPVSPEQGCKPQGTLSREAPGQVSPPFLGGGSTQLLRRLWWPPPQETLQGLQVSHSAHAPATVREGRAEVQQRGFKGIHAVLERGPQRREPSPSQQCSTDP